MHSDTFYQVEDAKRKARDETYSVRSHRPGQGESVV